jgi:hypothetical protein
MMTATVRLLINDNSIMSFDDDNDYFIMLFIKAGDFIKTLMSGMFTYRWFAAHDNYWLLLALQHK